MNKLWTRLEPLFARAFSADLERAYSYVDRLCLHLCFRVARECRLLQPSAEPFDHLVARSKIIPDAVYLVRTILDILCEEGFAKRTENGYEGLKQCPSDESDELQFQARTACSGAIPIFELIARCHDGAIDFVSGKKNGLAVVFARGDFGLWERVHSFDRVMSIYADLVAPTLGAIARPRMQVLEVGGGVGAVLQRSLSMLDRFEFDYTFTDLGQSFVQAAQRAYRGQRRLSFARLDLDSPLHDQGLPPESFDVVIAVNVLHVVRYLFFSLRELFNVLKPHGYLLLAEGSPPDRSQRWRLDIIFGFLRGWWNVSTDTHWRPRAGFLLPSEWKQALLECRYDPVHLLPGENWFRQACRGGVILAQKSSDPYGLAVGTAPGRI